MSGEYAHPSEYLYHPPAPGLHMPMRPFWNCTGCTGPWPCATKRRQLLAQYADARISLHLLMAMRLADAAGELGHVPSGDLDDRFLGWVRGAAP